MSTHTGHGLGAAGVCDADELLEEGLVLVVVPVAEDDGELGVVAVFLLWWVDDDGGAQTVDVLALCGGVSARATRPQCTRGLTDACAWTQ